ncbi:hypothetical protein [Viridibacillus arvi]|uniref:hypothetical protein n=1 Tax=Viridibacillus arvi TaxID=263475 RepID=UPI0034CE1A26
MNVEFEKIINRKNKITTGLSKKEIENLFVEYLLTQVEGLKKYFPTIIIPHYDGSILGLSYNPSTWTDGKAHMSTSTHNISLSCIGNYIYIGYGANSANGDGKIPFEPTMSKSQLTRIFKESIEMLVTGAYHEYNKYYKEENKVATVWYKDKILEDVIQN